MTSVKPLISVIITSYNYLHYITQAIDSVRAQTYPNVEIVVVDNCSTDGTVPAIRERYRDDPRVRIFENETNIGEYRNCNRGYELSTGEFVLWLSADDWLLPRHLERLAGVFEREPAIDVVHSGTYYAEAAGRVWTLRQMPGQLPFDYVDARDELIEMFLTNCPVCYPGALFRREIFLEVGLEDPDGGIHATDWEMQIRVAINGKRFAYLQDPSAVIRMHDAQGSGNAAYVENGRNVMDFVTMLDRYGDDPRMVRLRGREAGIVKNLDSLVQYAQTTAGKDPFSVPDRARIERWRETLLARAAEYEPAAVRSRQISVIVPAPQSPQLAARALASLERQTHPNWEVVLFDHGPFPLGEWLRSLPIWERMSYVRTPLSLPPGQARNYAMRLARGEYLAFLDEENVFAPEHLATLVGAIEQGRTSVAATASRTILEVADERAVEFQTLGEIRIHRTPDDPSEINLIANALPLNAVMFYRHMLDRSGGFNRDMWILEDYDFLVRLEAHGPIAFSSAPTLEVHAAVSLNTALGAYLGTYLTNLDRIYAAHPVSPAIDAARTAHRAAVEAAIARVAGAPVDVNAFAQLFATLAGRAVIPAGVPAR